MSRSIQKVAAIGAGTMGGGIAAHLANVGISVLLLDVVPPELDPEEASDPQARNHILRAGYERMLRAKPDNLASESPARYIELGNTEDDFDKIAECGCIVEVIVERLEPKRALTARIEEVRKLDAIVR